MKLWSRQPQSLDLRNGLQIDAPPIFISWRITEADLAPLLGTSVRFVKPGYWTAPVRIFDDLECSLGLHFGKNGRLSVLGIYRDQPMDLAASFADFQQHLERAFGLATWTQPGTAGFPSCRWLVAGVEIVHYVIDRFGPEEHLRIRQCWYGAVGKLKVW